MGLLHNCVYLRVCKRQFNGYITENWFYFTGLCAGVSINYRIHVNIRLVVTGFQTVRIVSRFELDL
jgi:hypothetical protein